MEQPLTAESAYAVLRDMPGIPIASRGELPKSAGLYGVWADDVLLYVGIAVNLRVRWQSHRCLYSIPTEYPSACLSWIPVEGSSARELELGLIRAFKPKYNKLGNPDWIKEVPQFHSTYDPAIEPEIMGTTCMYEVARTLVGVEIESSDLISIKDAALLLGCEIATISRLMQADTLPEYRAVPRFESNVQRYTSRKSVVAYGKKKESRALVTA